MRDRIDELFEIPGTTPSRSRKASKALRELLPKETLVASTPNKVEDGAPWWERPLLKRTVRIKGQPVVLYTRGALSLALEHPVITLRKWERDGKIPGAQFLLPAVDGRPGKNRLYTKAYIEGLITLAVDLGMRPGRLRPSAEFTKQAQALWRQTKENV